MVPQAEYERRGALAYLAAWDVHHARLFGRCELTTGIDPFGRLVEQVMSTEPHASPRRVFWVVDNGSSPGARRRSTGWSSSGATCAWSTFPSTHPGAIKWKSTSR